MQISDMNTPGKDFHKEFFDSTQKKPQLMPVEVNENDNNNRSSLPSGKESLPDFDKLPHIEDQQNRSQQDDAANQNSSSAPNDYQTFHFSMNHQNYYMDPNTNSRQGGYSIHSSDKHKLLLNKLAHKSAQLGGEVSSAIGVGVSSLEEKQKDGSSGDINWSETPGY